MTTSEAKTAAKTAACLIIGDEILSGKIHDLNSHTLAKALFQKGVRLQRVEVIPDDVDGIVEAARRLSQRFDYVFTSGGIGPTHDDLTYASIAQAFDRGLAHHQPTLQLMEAHYKARAESRGETFTGLKEDTKRMAELPDPADLLPVEGLWVPVVRVENVHVLPGVPNLFERMVQGVLPTLEGTPLHREMVYTQQSESDIAPVLRDAQQAHPEIAIGSYPRYVPQGYVESDPKPYRVMVTFDGPDPDATLKLSQQVEDAISGFRRDAPLGTTL